MVAIPFVGPTYTSRSQTLDAQRTINYYVEADEGQGGVVPAALYGTPGLELRYDLRTVSTPNQLGPLRGLYTTLREQRVYAVAGNTVVELSEDGSMFPLAAPLASLRGRVSMTDNATQLYITDGLKGSIVTLSTNVLQQITAPSYLGGGHATFQDGYFITVRPDSDQVFTSALNDGLTYNAADVSSADAKPDKLVAAFSDQRNLWLFGQDASAEIWYNAANPTGFPFSRIQGAVLESGAVNPWVIRPFSGTLVWLGVDQRGAGIVYAGQGPGAVRRISTHAIELEMQSWLNLGEAQSWSYQEQGHEFYVLWHPEGTVVYDFTTGMWHERASLDSNGLLQTSRGFLHTVGYGENLVGDYEDPLVYAMSTRYTTDNGRPIPRIRRVQYVGSPDRKLVKHARLEVDFERGVGLDGAPPVGVDPQIQLRWSDDYAQTWTDYRQVSMGKLGAYTQRARWDRLGVSRTRVYETYVTDPVFSAITGAWLNG